MLSVYILQMKMRSYNLNSEEVVLASGSKRNCSQRKNRVLTDAFTVIGRIEMSERYTIRVACYMFIFVGKKVLLMKRGDSICYGGFYTVPSGHLDENETPIQCAIRETFEEVDIRISEAEFSSVIHRVSKTPPKGCQSIDYMDFFFVCRSFTGVPKIMEPGKCSEIKYIDVDDLPVNFIPYVKLALDNLLGDNLECLSTEE